MRIADIEIGKQYIRKYVTPASKFNNKYNVYGDKIKGGTNVFPRVESLQRVTVVDKLSRGRVVIETERWTWKPPPRGTKSFGQWFMYGKKEAIRVVDRIEISARSLRPCD